ncbi:hypothetical protein PRK78_006523 [Emydomyces testavorans]|uniref:Cell morphogenesis protein Las1 n=1 Tax=Emydomyces testavorans TaxID=2070801 RepID=A0AAF0INP4_9EURO|nr:hypothetical protein PRK78_006523 [Emydomyces testavorans]
MPRLQFTPWKNHSQLVAVRDQFYPPPGYQGPDMRTEASALVWVWKVRGNLPHAVEATALLTDAIIHDDASKSSIFSIRATFVTGLVDSKLHGRKQTMYQKAMTLGVPASFVELRHEATHRELPSLVVLRNAAQRSLEWLWEFYWAKIEDSVQADSDPLEIAQSSKQVLNDEIWNILQSLTVRGVELNGSSKDKKRAESRRSAAIIRELAMICERENQGSVLVARALLRPGVLIPESRSFGDPMDHSMSTWNEFLKGICRHHTPFLTQLAEEMANALVESSSTDVEKDPYREGVYVWLEHVLKSSTWAVLRSQYLLLSYIQAVCADGADYWGGRLRGLVASYKGGPEFSARMEVSKISEDELGQTSLAVTEGESEIGSEMAALQAYGWNMNRRRTFKPIGVI